MTVKKKSAQYIVKYESRGLKKKLSKAAWLRCIDNVEDYYGLPLVTPLCSSGQSVDVEINVNVAPDINKSLMEEVPDNEDDWDFKKTVGRDEENCDGVKPRF